MNTRASSSLCAGLVPVGSDSSSQDADRDIQNLAVRQMGRASLTRFVHAALLYADGLRLSNLLRSFGAGAFFNAQVTA